MFVPVTYAVWHGANLWREQKGMPSLILEPVHVILLGLLIAFGGAIWQWRRGDTGPSPLERVAGPASPSRVAPSSKLSEAMPSAPSPTLELIEWRTNSISFWSGGDMVLGMVIRGKINQDQPVTLLNAYVVSDATGERKDLTVQISPGPRVVPISEVNEIPPNALLELWAIFTNPGLMPAEFLARWRSFRFHSEYGGCIYDVRFDSKDIERDAAASFPGVIGPRATAKSENK
jgi:hypothetical protein